MVVDIFWEQTREAKVPDIKLNLRCELEIGDL